MNAANRTIDQRNGQPKYYEPTEQQNPKKLISAFAQPTRTSRSRLAKKFEQIGKKMEAFPLTQTALSETAWEAAWFWRRQFVTRKDLKTASKNPKIYAVAEPELLRTIQQGNPCD